jgi:uncharacterized protein (TIGR03437 family)
MKRISLFLLCAAAALAQPTVDFTSGQAARALIGQSNFTAADPNSSDITIGAAGGLAYAGDTLFVADSNGISAAPSNNRVLLFQGVSSMLPGPTAQLSYSTACPICVGRASVVLGQPDFTTTTLNLNATGNALRTPTAVASDGVHVVVADSDHNRVLIWNRIPTTNNSPADVVVGQPDFTTSTPAKNPPDAKTMRGPQGVWIQNGKLYVADTQNNRVLIYNQIPTSNGAAADVALGQPNLTSAAEPSVSLSQLTSAATASNLLTPVAVTSDGIHLIVTDLGFNRILIWNSIPTSSGAPADVEIGQPDMTGSAPDNAYTTDANGVQTPVLCTVSNGTDTNSNPTYPAVCNYTISFPRFALSTGTRLFVADGGNDRIMVFNQIPTQNAQAADTIIGQVGGTVDQATDAADSMNTPTSMAWDGTNLYVSDPFNRRILVYSIGANSVPYQGAVNGASYTVNARGDVSIGGTITANDTVTITIDGTAYLYKILSTDTLTTVVTALVNLINSANSGAGDPNVSAIADIPTLQVLLQAKASGTNGNSVTYSTTISTSATITATAAGSTLSGGGDAASLAPGTQVAIQGTNLATQTVAADLTQPQLPTQLGGVQVYFNGIPAPIYLVSPTQIKAQLPWELNYATTTSVNAYVRTTQADGSVLATTPVAITIVPGNPGIYTLSQSDSTAAAVHGSSYALGIVSVDGTVTAGDVATVTIMDRSYTYTVQSGDTLDSIRDNLVTLINQDPQVSASAAGVYDRIILQARVQGPDGNGITYGGTASTSATVIVTPFGTSLCCANVENSPITAANPAVPGEFIKVYATGLGLPVFTGDNQQYIQTGVPYSASAPPTQPQEAVSSLAGGSTADVLSATLEPGNVGVFEVVLHLNTSLPTNPLTAVTIAQNAFTSNSVTISVVSK